MIARSGTACTSKSGLRGLHLLAEGMAASSEAAVTEGMLCAGYGGRRPRDCWLSAWLVALEVIYGQLLDAITLGIIFARIAHPKNRARTVFISDSAVIARRDGALKFMFRVADVRQTQVILPSACHPLSVHGRPLKGLLLSS